MEFTAVQKAKAIKTASDNGLNSSGGGSALSKEIDYIDIQPKPFVVQIPLVEYFERVKRHKADRWQENFCERLQQAAIKRPTKREWAIIHAEAQLGKSSILAQTLAAWLIGHDPLIRFALATYNVTKSQQHSKAVIGIMNLSVHKQIFPNKDGWVSEKASKEKWSTPARLDLHDAQESFNPVGLQSGLTGSGFDWLIIDDPYADQKEAFSETVRQNLEDFWDFSVMSRVGLYSNVFGMFHRYHVQDLAGYLLDRGDFDYWRYAAICDGDYIHDETGRRYPDPLGRQVGEYISERRKPDYYAENRKNKRVWNSMFQGKPTSDEGDFFNVGKITYITEDEAAFRRQECIAFVRAWDNAATEGGGDWTCGMFGGIRPNGKVTIFNTKLKQVDTAGRLELQKTTAERDGKGVIVGIPKDPAAAGKDTVFFTEQHLEGFSVMPRPTSGTKRERARNFSVAVNAGDVEFVLDSNLEDDEKWNKQVRKSLHDFDLSDFDDPVDAGGDMYNCLYEIFRKGLVIKNFKPQRNLVGLSVFSQRFPFAENQFKIPEKFTVYVGVKLNAESSKPSSAVIAARASEISGLKDTLFVVAEYKQYDGDVYRLFDWIDRTLKEKCAKPEGATIWLHRDSENYLPTIRQKLKQSVMLFDEDNFAGLTELNWYLRPRETANPFNDLEQASGLYLLSDDNQFSVATDENGLYSTRQELTTWGFNDKGEPSQIGQVLDCLRMVTYQFRTFAASLTEFEKSELNLPEHLRLETVIEAHQKGEITGHQKAHRLNMRPVFEAMRNNLSKKVEERRSRR